MNLEDLLAKRKTIKWQISKASQSLTKLSGKGEDDTFKLDDLNVMNAEHGLAKLTSYIEELRSINGEVVELKLRGVDDDSEGEKILEENDIEDYEIKYNEALIAYKNSDRRLRSL